MAEREFYIGTSGPYFYDDTDTDANLRYAINTDGQLNITGAPAADAEAVRLQDLNGRVFTATEVADIDDPSAELLLIGTGIDEGSTVMCYEAKLNQPNEWTMYVKDVDANTNNPPYVVPGAEGYWVAVAGKYDNGRTSGFIFNEHWRLYPSGSDMLLQYRASVSSSWEEVIKWSA